VDAAIESVGNAIRRFVPKQFVIADFEPPDDWKLYQLRPPGLCVVPRGVVASAIRFGVSRASGILAVVATGSNWPTLRNRCNRLVIVESRLRSAQKNCHRRTAVRRDHRRWPAVGGLYRTRYAPKEDDRVLASSLTRLSFYPADRGMAPSLRLGNGVSPRSPMGSVEGVAGARASRTGIVDTVDPLYTAPNMR
jgi:hypothetical protein